jgi:hypothetical protein
MSQCPLLLQTTVAMGDFYPSLLCYHCSDGPVARGHSGLRPVATMSICSSGEMVIFLDLMRCMDTSFRRAFTRLNIFSNGGEIHKVGNGRLTQF